MASRKTRSGSLTNASTFEELRQLILNFEAKIISRLDNIESKINSIDTRLDLVQAEQITMKNEADHLKRLVVSQQQQIEAIENDLRKQNVIFSGVSESEIHVGDKILRDDTEKIEYLCEQTGLNAYDQDYILSCSRIGRPIKGRDRLMKVKFRSLSPKREVLRSQKVFRQTDTILSSFGKVFVSPDSSFLSRKEDRRLRERMREMRASLSDSDHLFIRKGVLYKNNVIVDRVNIANQLF